jgi:glycosyltransferase involved in cell wall biosynthesis
LWELYIRNPNADRYAIFQDDFVTYKNLRQYLDSQPYPKRGYWNLYTFPVNQKLAKGTKGFYLSNQMGKGAVALVFNKEAVQVLLNSKHFVNKVAAVRHPTSSVDGAIVTAMKNEGYLEYVHNPSLVQHTGLQSSMGNINKPENLATSFRGQEFNAMDLTNNPIKKDTSKLLGKVDGVKDPVIDFPANFTDYESLGTGTGTKPQTVNIPSFAIGIDLASGESKSEYLTLPVNDEPIPRIGLVGYRSQSGLGELNRQLEYYLPITSRLIIPHGKFPYEPLTLAPNEILHDKRSNTLEKFVRSVDIILFCETPYDKKLVAIANAYGKRIVCIPMLEWTPVRGGWIRDVDLFICPTAVCYHNLIKDNLPCEHFSWPIDTYRFKFKQRKTCDRFLFLNGNGGFKNRKGFDVVKQALELWPEFPLNVRSQKSIDWPKTDNLDILSPEKNNGNLYNEGDVLIVPHSVDGLGLEVLEALASGMPVIATNGEPWNEFQLLDTIPSELTPMKFSHRVIPGYKLCPEDLVAKCKEWVGKDITQSSIEARDYAEEKSMELYAPELLKLVVG